MAHKSQLLKSKSRKDLAEVAEFLHGLADKIAANELVLQQGEESLQLELPTSVVFEIEVQEKRKKRSSKRSLEIEIEWYEGEASENVQLG